MSEPKFTQGPWVVEDGGSSSYFQSFDISGPDTNRATEKWRRRGREVASISAHHAADVPSLADTALGYGASEAKANAHLIAAAPELYEALARLTAEFGDKSVDHENVRAAFAALAKARGET